MQRSKTARPKSAKGNGTVRNKAKTRPANKASRPVAAAARNKAAAKAVTPLVFRPRTAADDAYILQLTEDQLGDIHRNAFGEAFPREQFGRYLESGAPTVVVERDNKRLGYYSYLVGRDGKMHISAMVIEPHYQSEGVGSEVMKRLEQEAAAQGVHTLEVFVQANNEKSLAFTRKLGFTEVFRLEPNTICFQKRLQLQPRPQGTPGPMGGPQGQPAQPGEIPASMHPFA